MGVPCLRSVIAGIGSSPPPPANLSAGYAVIDSKWMVGSRSAVVTSTVHFLLGTPRGNLFYLQQSVASPNFWHVVVAHSQRAIGRTDSNCVNSFMETQPWDQWACRSAVRSPVATVWLTERKSAGSPSQTTVGTGPVHTHTRMPLCYCVLMYSSSLTSLRLRDMRHLFSLFAFPEPESFR